MSEFWAQYITFIKARGNIENVMIVSSEDGSLFATSDESFYLKEYSAKIMQEDGNEKDEVVNEAVNLVKYMKGQSVSQGLRINATKKQQITRSFKDEQTNLQTIFAKFPQGGSCIANGGKCILIGTYDENKNHSSPECNETITVLARYLARSVWPSGDASDGAPDEGAPATWQSYIDILLVGKGNVAEALICSAVDGSILASTSGFKFQTYTTEIPQEDGTDVEETVDEAKNFLKLLIQKSKPSQGLRLNKVKFQIIRQFEDENSACNAVMGKKTMGGCALFNCGKCLIAVTYDEAKNHTSPGCVTVASEVAKYLKTALK